MIYDNDPRVGPRNDDVTFGGETHRVKGYTVTTEEGVYLVLDATGPGFGWTICHSEPPYPFVAAGDGLAVGLPDAETAIRALLGLPQLEVVK